MADNVNDAAGEHSGESSDQSPAASMELSVWLESLGTPSSITSMMPADLRSIDIGAFMRMLGGVGIETGASHSNDPIATSGETQQIQWLPITRS